VLNQFTSDCFSFTRGLSLGWYMTEKAAQLQYITFDLPPTPEINMKFVKKEIMK